MRGIVTVFSAFIQKGQFSVVFPSSGPSGHLPPGEGFERVDAGQLSSSCRDAIYLAKELASPFRGEVAERSEVGGGDPLSHGLRRASSPLKVEPRARKKRPVPKNRSFISFPDMAF